VRTLIRWVVLAALTLVVVGAGSAMPVAAATGSAGGTGSGVGAGSAVAAGSVLPTAILPDCKEAPEPNSPYGNPLSLRPETTSTGDPFAKGATVSIYSVYGSGYGVAAYDNGCNPIDGVMPTLGANIFNTVGLEWPATMSSLGRSLQSLVVDPDRWIGALDQPVEEATSAVTEGFWKPWITVALLLVAALVLGRSATGQIAGALTAIVWALLLLVVSSWLVNYPSEAVDLVDDGVQTATVQIANGFGGGTASTATDALEQQWDDIDRATSYRAWLEASFGSSTSRTATSYGPDLFRATHFSWSEWDAYQADPTGRGSDVIEAKAAVFDTTVDKIRDADPIAYDHLTGNRWGDRIGLAVLSYLVFLCAALFLVIATVGVLLAYLVTRLVVPLGPVAGVLFLLEPMRGAILGKLQKVAAILVMGPAYLLAALVVLRVNSAVLGSDGVPRPLQYLIVAVVSFLAWRLIRPASVAGTSSKLGRMLRQAAAIRLGTRALRQPGQGDYDAEARARDPRPYAQSTPGAPGYWRSTPVVQPPPLPTLAAGGSPYYAAVSSAPGTFVDRPAVATAHLPHRLARSLPPGPDAAGRGAITAGPSVAARGSGASPAIIGTEAAAVLIVDPSPRDIPPGIAPDRGDPPAVRDDAGRGNGSAPRLPTFDLAAPPDPPPRTGRVLAPEEQLPPDTHDSNLVFTPDGSRVNVIYRPNSRSVNVPAH
jgi:hypothetical protein